MNIPNEGQIYVCNFTTMAKKKAAKKLSKRGKPLKVNTSFENLLRMVINTPPKKKK